MAVEIFCSSSVIVQVSPGSDLNLVSKDEEGGDPGNEAGSYHLSLSH